MVQLFNRLRSLKTANLGGLILFFFRNNFPGLRNAMKACFKKTVTFIPHK
jgi:hypothetical protein